MGAPAAGHWHDSEPRRIGAALRIPHLAVTRRIHAGLAARFPDLTLAHLGVFQQCDHPPGGTRQTELAERLGVTKQSLGETVDALERLGYVERRPDPADRRARLVCITARGWAVHQYAYEIADGIESELAALIGREQFTSLLGLLNALATALQRADQG